jgi:hypothetical protein
MHAERVGIWPRHHGWNFGGALRVNEQYGRWNVSGLFAKTVCIGACLIGTILLGLSPVWAEDAGPDPAALGMTEALLSFCSKVAPADVDRFQQQVEMLSKNVSAQRLAEVRQSDAYRNAHKAVDDFTAKVDPHNARLVCAKPDGKTK